MKNFVAVLLVSLVLTLNCAAQNSLSYQNDGLSIAESILVAGAQLGLDHNSSSDDVPLPQIEASRHLESCAEKMSSIQLVVESFPTPNMAGFNTYRYFLDVNGFEDDPLPYITACFGIPNWPVILDCPGGSFFNSPLNAGPSSAGINPALFPFFPELEYDSYIGLAEDDSPASGNECGEINYVQTEGPATVYDTFINGSPVNSDELDFAFFNIPNQCERNTPSGDGTFFVMQLTASAPPRVRMYWQVIELVSLDVITMREHRVGFDIVGSGTFNGYEFRPDGGSYFGYSDTMGPICSCDDESALNFSIDALTVDPLSCIYNYVGCSDESACNYVILSEDQLEDCEYTSCNQAEMIPVASDNCSGPDCCLDGTIWDSQTNGCVSSSICNADIDNNGSVGLGDLLDLLSEYGQTCGFDWNADWTCGVDWYHQGTWYGTAEYGDQCWFTDNLSATSFENGSEIQPFSDTGEISYSQYGESHSEGLLYSGLVLEHSESICPLGWHVPSDVEWMALEIAHGMTEQEAMEESYRGYFVANSMRSNEENANWEVMTPNIAGWSEYSSYYYSTNELGFNARPGGYIDGKGSAYLEGYAGLWWTSSPHDSNSRWCRVINSYLTRPSREPRSNDYHAAIRCVKDNE